MYVVQGIALTLSLNLKSFFRIPKEINRARLWVIACGRDDLLGNLDILNKSHHLCGAHFENYMFLNDLHNRLQPHAVPTIFPSLEGSSSELADHNYSFFIPHVILH